MNIIYNGELIHEKEFPFSIHDRAFQYGDGIFETMTCNHHGGIVFLNDHLDRIKAGCQAIDLLFPEETIASKLNNHIQVLLKENNIKKGRVKLTIYRKSGGFYISNIKEANWMLSLAPLHKSDRKDIHISFSKKTINSHSSISAYKNLSSLQYIIAGNECQSRELDDLIILDEKGNISEATSSNIIWMKNKQLYSPDLKTGCVDGIMLKQLRKKVTIEAAIANKDELLQADQVFLCNVSGIVTVKHIDNTQYNTELPKAFLTI